MTPLTVSTSSMDQISHQEIGLIQYEDRDFRETTVCVLPMYHVFGMNVTMSNVLRAGGKLVTLSAFNPGPFLRTLITYRPTFLHLAPPVLNFLTTHAGVKTHHLESLRYILVGAAPVAPALIQRFKEKAPHVDFREGWGMSELSPAGCFSRQGKSVIGSCGQVLPNTTMKVISLQTGDSMPPGDNNRGELLVKGPQVMKGYLNNQEATQKTLDKDGWLRTGDMAYYDEEHNIFMVDRLKEIIKCKGYQVSPSELEDILRKNVYVKDTAVLGTKSDER